MTEVIDYVLAKHSPWQKSMLGEGWYPLWTPGQHREWWSKQDKYRTEKGTVIMCSVLPQVQGALTTALEKLKPPVGAAASDGEAVGDVRGANQRASGLYPDPDDRDQLKCRSL
ncbi:UNVERIFIED_CONTAM: hypothetical protein FKN15_025666 [Acipenser sinensis]